MKASECTIPDGRGKYIRISFGVGLAYCNSAYLKVLALRGWFLVRQKVTHAKGPQIAVCVSLRLEFSHTLPGLLVAGSATVRLPCIIPADDQCC